MRSTVDQLVACLKEEGPVVLLESQSVDHPEGRISYLAARPQAVIKAYGNRVTIENALERSDFYENPWDALIKFRQDYKDWIFGYFGYDLNNYLEDLKAENPDLVQAPDMYFMVPQLLVEFNHETGSINMLKGTMPEIKTPKRITDSVFTLEQLRPTVSKSEYIDCILKAQDKIKEGEFYEINLSHQMQAACNGDSYELYQKMRTVGPVPFGAYLSFDKWGVCCQSPERFLNKVGLNITSQPIKGTIQRGESAEEDDQLKKKLKDSLKDKAENLMIVDLVRNDLGRVAEKGTVNVADLFEVQTFGTVHQMVSTIRALSTTDDPIQIIKACYPMGSMTGAPKISAMKSIEELERYRRGIYSGTIGYISPAGDFDFNVVIRTALVKGENLFYAVGGAITGDSDPGAEWRETLIKARALTKILDAYSDPDRY